ncbi:homodimeric dihydroxyacetone kinase [Halopolyspora algeriensis]|uniref:Homodimeric dihydroxyacetone kinase n=1 Tax=Halopolyspora algeriensis TaxID=1500506 RepID=A0A368W0Z5_9ACTN|nr:dihydroxyacetone kinase family protein [Halopolyspora algeriensis]RCW47302.1 homodimeric dihydroxyacetone kinase [Halopolyspora algeriensis]TQM42537.1 homodimeric dihydroxyacetone kinase [Halopolyspora algeriensis]
MTGLVDAASFKSAWLDGFVTAYGRTVRKVPGAYGVVGRHAPRPGKVSVIIGGGCGHYPAFAGLVGPGLADAAVIGDVFTSPSAEQVYRTARAADGGAGVLFSYGNYSGDVMHFGLAARRLAAEGIDSRTVLVTDDVASGTADNTEARRGVAGDFFVFKVAGAAAERGDDLDTVAALASKANVRTRTYGAAFGGCTLPGQVDPLFTVEPGRVELGLGIHGEPGARTVDRMSAQELAAELVDTLLPQLPDGADRVAVLLNGLGRTKYEELFACYPEIERRLRSAGLRPHRPEVGEFVTSLDMAGLSLSLMVLDDELAELYDAGCATPGFRALIPQVSGENETREAPYRSEGVPDEARHGGVVHALLVAALDRVSGQEEELGRLDAVAGDGDHGQGIVRGLRAAVDAADRAGSHSGDARSVGDALLSAGTALADAAGGASGALYGALLGETGAGLRLREGSSVDTTLLADAVRSACGAVAELGGAQRGDKTLLDALEPFRDTLTEQAHSGADVVPAVSVAALEATKAAEATAELVSARGRASRLGARDLGTPDPGATSLALMLTAFGEALTGGACAAEPSTESRQGGLT